MKNLTITVDERTVSWARLEAARRGMSVSRLVGEMLESRMEESRRYTEAMRLFLSKKPYHFRTKHGRYASRDELHDRPGLR